MPLEADTKTTVGTLCDEDNIACAYYSFAPPTRRFGSVKFGLGGRTLLGDSFIPERIFAIRGRDLDVAMSSDRQEMTTFC